MASLGAAEGDEGPITRDLILLVVLGVGVLAILVVATMAASRRYGATAEAKAELRAELDEIVAASRRVHDSGSLEVLRARDPRELGSTWDDVESEIGDLEAQVSTLAATTRDARLAADLYYLHQCLADLRVANEAYVSTRLRIGAENRADLTEQDVTDRRRNLQSAIDPVAAAIRG